jgi:hypothetical protein
MDEAITVHSWGVLDLLKGNLHNFWNDICATMFYNLYIPE